jgi:hypothetical protein
MDTITLRAANAVLAATAENGGATFEGRTLLPFTPADGFAVAVGGVRYPAAQLDANTLGWLAKAVTSEYETTYAGTWVEGSTAYVDAVRYFAADKRGDAKAAGRYYGQKAIFDFGAGESIYLDEEGL